MFRFVFVLTLCLLVAFTGVGLTISHEWGWQDYASNELYVVYKQSSLGVPRYFIVHANGMSEAEELHADENVINDGYDCSPDGKTLAYITSSNHLYVITEGKLRYEKIVGSAYTFNVANDGSVILWDSDYNFWFVDPTQISSVPLPRAGYNIARIASDGRILWRSGTGAMLLASTNDNSLIPLKAAAHLSAEWLGDEETIVFEAYDFSGSPSDFDDARYIMDVKTQQVARLNHAISPAKYSPDGTVAVNTWLGIFNPLMNISVRRVVPANEDFTPLCFLTFRPQMLIAENP